MPVLAILMSGGWSSLQAGELVLPSYFYLGNKKPPGGGYSFLLGNSLDFFSLWVNAQIIAANSPVIITPPVLGCPK